MMALDMMLQVNVVAETPTEESGIALAEHIVDLGDDHSSYSVYPDIKVSEEDDDLFHVIVTLYMLPENLERNLIILDGVKAGYTKIHDKMVFSDSILKNIRVFPILDGMHGGTEAVNNLNRYLINKVQEQAKDIAGLEKEISEINKTQCKIATILQGHQERYESMQVYIHSYVDLTSMAKIVRALAEEIDPNLLDDFTTATVH